MAKHICCKQVIAQSGARWIRASAKILACSHIAGEVDDSGNCHGQSPLPRSPIRAKGKKTTSNTTEACVFEKR